LNANVIDATTTIAISTANICMGSSPNASPALAVVVVVNIDVVVAVVVIVVVEGDVVGVVVSGLVVIVLSAVAVGDVVVGGLYSLGGVGVLTSIGGKCPTI